VKLVEKNRNIPWAIGMAYHHENDGQTFTDGNGGVAFHTAISRKDG
jgi:hypothetical protein